MPVRVLLAEDSLVNQMYIQKFLDALGCHVCAVGNANQAMLALRSANFDVVLLDFQLPDATGLEVARVALDTTDPPRVAVVTGGLTAQQQAACTQLGVEVVEKPVSRQTLEAIVLARPHRPNPTVGEQPGALLTHLFDAPTVVDLLTTFLQQAPGLVAQITRGHEIAAAAHRLKSSAMTVQALQLGRCAANIERAVTGGQSPTAHQCRELERALASTCDALDQLCRNVQANCDAPG